jgi:hypothetical protein
MKNYFNNIYNLTQLSDNTCDPKFKKQILNGINTK